LATLIDYTYSYIQKQKLAKQLKQLKKLKKLGKKHSNIIKYKQLNKREQKFRIEYNTLLSFSSEWVDEEFEKTITIKSETKEITFLIKSTGEFKTSADGTRWLLCYNQNTGMHHYVKFAEEPDTCALDYDWMEKERIVHIEEEVPSIFEGWEYDVMPCDENPEDCGVTCFNCSRGN
jgi:hypothetical protein